MSIAEKARRDYHLALCADVLRLRSGRVNTADSHNVGSIQISQEIVDQIGVPLSDSDLKGQAAGSIFERLTANYLETMFAHLEHTRPGQWHFEVGTHIEEFEQYSHLKDLRSLIKNHPELAAILRDSYIVAPDIVVARSPLLDAQLNEREIIVSAEDSAASLTSLREGTMGEKHRILHASISCKWTLRSDRAQNVRTEALNLIRARKGHTPHIVAVVAEPLPTRIASIAQGTGDLDCVYHFALHELRVAVAKHGNQDQIETLETLVSGRRLRDISDLPFDLAL